MACSIEVTILEARSTIMKSHTRLVASIAYSVAICIIIVVNASIIDILAKRGIQLREMDETLNKRGVWMRTVDARLDALKKRNHLCQMNLPIGLTGSLRQSWEHYQQ